jgi:hypothetical protein
MIGLFAEFVADERAECQDDPERLRFVEDLLAQVKSVEANLEQVHLSSTVQKLKFLHESADHGFSNDPVMAHLNDLIEEIENAAASNA